MSLPAAAACDGLCHTAELQACQGHGMAREESIRTPLIPMGGLWGAGGCRAPFVRLGTVSPTTARVSSPACCFLNQDGKGWSREGGSILPQGGPCWEASLYHQGQSTRTCFWTQGIHPEQHLPHALSTLFRVDACSGLNFFNAGS